MKDINYKGIGILDYTVLEKQIANLDSLIELNKGVEKQLKIFTKYIRADFALNSVQVEAEEEQFIRLEKKLGELKLDKYLKKNNDTTDMKTNAKYILGHRSVKAHRSAQDYLFGIAREDENFYLDHKHIKLAHALVFSNNELASKVGSGHYRNEAAKVKGDFGDVSIVGAPFPVSNVEDVPIEMNILLYKFNDEWKDYAPIDRAALLHAEFVRIHPFLDGNGRVARMLANMVLVSKGYPPFTVRPKDKLKYIDSLNKTIMNNDVKPFAKFLAEKCKGRIDAYNTLTVNELQAQAIKSMGLQNEQEIQR